MLSLSFGRSFWVRRSRSYRLGGHAKGSAKRCREDKGGARAGECTADCLRARPLLFGFVPYSMTRTAACGWQDVQ
eukprot:6205052-Pleurochrysis_carterae.AAC.1